MKVKLSIPIFILFLVIVFISTSLAYDYTELRYPEDAAVGLGKGGITGDIVFSPDSEMIAIPSHLGIWLYDARTYKKLKILTTNSTSFKFSPDGTMLVSYNSRNNTIQLWDMTTRSTLGKHISIPIEPKRDISSVKFSPDAKILAGVSNDNTIILYDTQTGKQKTALKGHTDEIISLAFAPDNSIVGSSSYDRTVRLWEITTGRLLHVLKEKSQRVISIVFSTDSRLLANVTQDLKSEDTNIRLWSTKTGRKTRTMQGTLNRSPRGYYDVNFSPDNRIIASVSDIETKLWNVRTGKLLNVFKSRFVISPDWSLYAGTRQDKILLLDMKTREQMRTLTGFKTGNTPLVFSPDGKKIANDLGIWDVDTNNHVYINEPHVSTGYAVRFIEGEETLVCWGNNSTVQLWNTKTGHLTSTFSGEIFSVSSDSKTLAGGFKNRNTLPVVNVWDTETGKLKQTFPINPDKARDSLVISPNGETLVCRHSKNQTFELWDVGTGEHKLTFNSTPDHIRSVVFFPDSKTLVGLGSQDIPLWDVKTGEQIANLKGHTSEVDDIFFSPDERIIASTSADETVRLWDSKSHEHIATLIGHTSGINSVVFSPDGETVATESYDGTTRLWNTKTGKHKKALLGHRAVAFYPDGSILVSLSEGIQFLNIRIDEPTLLFKVEIDNVSSVVFSSDGKTMASVGSAILLWDLSDSISLLSK
ncbi:WD40 repeat domain-containing protein [Candidatus Poribacteria bacterium]|nr:WD40 repeat domain-containing protein [Candidatus Poribacteria bacterium]MYB66627.1 WD40 repeat domain-containing protein [Candidatus Poribacteria bacterium]